MRTILTFFLAAFALFGQARQMVLCDNQSPRNCFAWDIGANLGSNLNISGPVLPINGESSGVGRGTMTGHMLLAGGFGNAGTIKLGSNIDALPDTTGIYGAAQSGNDCTFPPAWSSSTTYNVGDIVSSGGVTYTGIASGNVNHMPPNASWWTNGCIDDRTRMDWLGFEGVFFRIKAHGTGGTEIGDYFDWTRYGATNALPPHQVNFQDSSFNVLIHIDSGSNFRFTNFDYSGEIRFGLNSGPGVTTGITQNGPGIVELNNGAALANAGTAVQLRLLGLLVNQDNDSSGYQIQSNGGIEMTTADASHNIFSKGTAANAISTDNGGNGGGITAGTGANGGFWVGANQVVNTARVFDGSGVSVTGTISTSSGGSIAINASAGGINAFGAYFKAGNQFIDDPGSGPRFTGSGGVFTSGSGTFNGDVGTNGKFNVGASTGQTATLVASGTCTITVTGGVITGHTGC